LEIEVRQPKTLNMPVPRFIETARGRTVSKLPEKYQFKLTFSDKTGFTIHFSWFGYIHLLPETDLAKHKQTGKLGISPISEEFTLEHFRKLLGEGKAGIKSFLLNQKNIAGIGNVYIQRTSLGLRTS